MFILEYIKKIPYEFYKETILFNLKFSLLLFFEKFFILFHFLYRFILLNI